MKYVMSLLLEWQNAVFAASIAFWIVYLFISLLSGGAGDHLGAHAEGDLDHDHDVDHDMGHEHVSKDVNHGGPSGHGWGHALLSYLGLGRCPLSIVLMVLGISWGFVGLVCNGIFEQFLFIPAGIYFWGSAFIALLVAMPFTSFVSRIMAKIMPRKGTTAIELDSLVGKYGESSITIDSKSGRVKVLDGHGTLHNLYCKTAEGDEPIPPNTEVIVLNRMPNDGFFIVKRKPQMIANA